MCAALGRSILAKMACGVHAKPADTLTMVDGKYAIQGRRRSSDAIDDSLPKNQWPMAIVKEIFKSSDGLV